MNKVVLLLFLGTLYLFGSSTYTPWTLQQGRLDEVEKLFVSAHQQEQIPPISFPEGWEAMDDPHKMLYLINQERITRGLEPLAGISKRVMSISQSYADLLLHMQKFSHRADGKNSWMRLLADPEIQHCMNRIEYAENLALFASNKGYQKFYIERAVYAWMYEDESQNWRHREMLLYRNDTPIYIGVGISMGETKKYNYNVYIVLNYLSPCKDFKDE